MKNLLTLICLLIGLSLTAQTDSTAPKKAMKIQPIIVTAEGDTAIYLHWKAFDLDGYDTTVGMNTVVSLWDRNGRILTSFNVPIPVEVVNIWAYDPKPIEDFILQKYPRYRRRY